MFTKFCSVTLIIIAIVNVIVALCYPDTHIFTRSDMWIPWFIVGVSQATIFIMEFRR